MAHLTNRYLVCRYIDYQHLLSRNARKANIVIPSSQTWTSRASNFHHIVCQLSITENQHEHCSTKRLRTPRRQLLLRLIIPPGTFSKVKGRHFLSNINGAMSPGRFLYVASLCFRGHRVGTHTILCENNVNNTTTTTNQHE